MNAPLRLLSLVAVLLLTCPARADSTVSPALPASDPILAEALSVLESQYVDFSSLGYKQGDRLDDLIARSHGQISLVTPKPGDSPATIITASLPGLIVYWRLGSFTPKTNWSDLASQLESMVMWGIGGSILDLRDNKSPGDFEGANQIVAMFSSHEDTALSKFRWPMTIGPDHTLEFPLPGASVRFHPFPDHGPLVILINNQTTGAAAALAACLKAEGALVIGRATGAGATPFAETNLSNGQILRYAIAPLRLPDGGNLGDHPVVPDISLTVNEQAEKSALALIGQGRVLDVIAEAAQRNRLNEAALVRGDDPEQDAELASRENKSAASPAAPAQDLVLVSAIDSLKAIDLSQRRAPASAAAR